LRGGRTLVSLRFPKLEESDMAKGQMRSNKEPRKPKKDASKKAPAPVKAAPVTAAKQKDTK